jgi:SAM-dependent methyltransferase
MRLALLALIVTAGCTGRGTEPRLDSAGRDLLDPAREKMMHPEAIIARLALPADARVADIGAGPGFLTLPLARAVPRGSVVATDVRADYLELLRLRAAVAGLSSSITTRLAPPDDPDLADGEVDLAVLCQVDHYLRDRVAYFRKLAHGVRPGGRIALINYERFRQVALAAADRVDLRTVDDWQIAPGFFALVFMGSE